MALPGQFDHPSFSTAFGTVFGYLLILAVMTLVLFLVPYAFFALF